MKIINFLFSIFLMSACGSTYPTISQPQLTATTSSLDLSKIIAGVPFEVSCTLENVIDPLTDYTETAKESKACLELKHGEESGNWT